MSVIVASIPVLKAIYSDYSMNPKDFEKETIVDREETISKLKRYGMFFQKIRYR